MKRYFYTHLYNLLKTMQFFMFIYIFPNTFDDLWIVHLFIFYYIFLLLWFSGFFLVVIVFVICHCIQLLIEETKRCKSWQLNIARVLANGCIVNTKNYNSLSPNLIISDNCNVHHPRLQWLITKNYNISFNQLQSFRQLH